MSEKNIVLIPGDGIGTEIIAAAKAVCDVAFEKAGVKVNCCLLYTSRCV